MNKLRSLTHEFIIALVCSRALTSSSRAESAWMEFFELIIFEGINEMNSEADFFSLYMKNFEELGFSQVFMENKGDGEQRADRFFIVLEETWQTYDLRRKNLLPEKDLLAWLIRIFRWSSKLFRDFEIISIKTYFSLSPPPSFFVFLQQLFHFENMDNVFISAYCRNST